MSRVNKFHGPDKQVLADISLSFFPGAKIGVLGPNGAGKSTLLRIMAGLDDELPTARRRAGARRHRRLPAAGAAARPGQGRARQRRGGRRPRRAALLDRFDEICAQLAEPDADDEMDALLDEQGEVQDRIERARRLGPRPQARHRHGRAAAARRPTPTSTTLSGGERRRVALCRLLLSAPDLLLLDEPTNHLDAESVAWLERFLERVPGHRRGRHPRPLLPRQRGRLDPRARPRPRHPLRGQLLVLAGAEGGAAGAEEKQESARQRTLQRELEWVRMAPRARQAKSKARLARLRAAAGRGAAAASATTRRDPHPGRRRAWAIWWSRPSGLRKGFGDRLLIEDLSFSLPPRRHRRRHRPQRRRQDHAVPHDRRPGAARRRRAARRRHRGARLRRPVARRRSTRQDRLGGDLGRQGPDHARQARGAPRAPTCRASTSAAPTSRSGSASSPAASATGCTWPSCCAAAATCCCSTSPPTTSTWTRCARSRRRCSTSPAARWSSRHDRWFLDRIATHILAFEGDSQVVWFEGNYEEYEENRRQRLGRRGGPAAPDQVQAARSQLSGVRLKPDPQAASRRTAATR